MPSLEPLIGAVITGIYEVRVEPSNRSCNKILRSLKYKSKQTNNHLENETFARDYPINREKDAQIIGSATPENRIQVFLTSP